VGTRGGLTEVAHRNRMPLGLWGVGTRGAGAPVPTEDHVRTDRRRRQRL